MNARGVLPPTREVSTHRHALAAAGAVVGGHAAWLPEWANALPP